MDELENYELGIDEAHLSHMADFWKLVSVMDRAGLLERVVPVFGAAEYLLTRACRFGMIRPLLVPYTVEFLMPDPFTPLSGEAADCSGLGRILTARNIMDDSRSFIFESQLTVEFVAASELVGRRRAVDSVLGFPLRTIPHTRFLLADLIKARIGGYVFFLPSPEAYIVAHMVDWDNHIYPADAPDPMIRLWRKLDLDKLADIIAGLDTYEYRQVRDFLKYRRMKFSLPERRPDA